MIEDLLKQIPCRKKYLGTINDAHFVLRKLVSSTNNTWRAYYEDEDTEKSVDGFDFVSEGIEECCNKLLDAIENHDSARNTRNSS